jgi:hypothetical protein
MSTSELKELLIDTIRNIEDAELLEDIYQLLSLPESTTVYKFNDDELRAIKEAEDQIRNGDYLTDEEVDKAVEEWLNK